MGVEEDLVLQHLELRLLRLEVRSLEPSHLVEEEGCSQGLDRTLPPKALGSALLQSQQRLPQHLEQPLPSGRRQHLDLLQPLDLLQVGEGQLLEHPLQHLERRLPRPSAPLLVLELQTLRRPLARWPPAPVEALSERWLNNLLALGLLLQLLLHLRRPSSAHGDDHWLSLRGTIT